MGIGLRLKIILRDRKMTIKQLSEKADISINTLYSITKRDSESIDPVILQRISEALGIPYWQLLGGVEMESGEIQIPITLDTDAAKKLGVDNLKPGEQINKTIIPNSNEGQALLNSLGIKFSDSDKLQQGSYLAGTEVPLISAFRKLNDDGKKKAVERVEELTEIQKYQARKEDISEVLSDLMPDSPNIRENFISAIARLPEEGLPIIAEYIVSMCQNPKAYLNQTDEERAADTKRLAEQMIKAIEEHKSEE